MPKKALYSFEEAEEGKNRTVNKSAESNADDEKSLNSGDDANSGFPPAKKLKTCKSKQKPGRPAFAYYLEKYFNERPTACRRIVPLPRNIRNIYKRNNCKRRAQTLKLIKRSESEDTQLMLNEHVVRSVYFYRHQVENRKDEIKTNGVNLEAEDKLDVKAQESHERKPSERKSIKELKQESRDISGDINLLDEADLTSTIDPQQDALKTATIDAIATTNTTVATTTATAPIIPANRPPPQHAIASSLISKIPFIGIKSPDSHSLEREVAHNLNRLVRMKIRDIGNALTRKTKVIPATSDNILCIIPWRNFLDAFVEGHVFLWQVHTSDNSCFLAATIQEVMPRVNGAMAIMNIMTLHINEMPMMARMLKQKFEHENTRELAIVMQGHPNYWLVRGFLRGDKKSACQNPTRRTHPLLAKKVNWLASLLAKQHAQAFTTVLKPLQENQQQQGQRPRSPQQQLPSTQQELQPTDIQSNIKFRKATVKDLVEIQQIITSENNHRWLVLDVYWDFSHISIPEICKLIEVERIQKVLSYSQQSGKIVKLQLLQNAPFDAFVTPNSKSKVYFGPLKVESKLPILLLLQSVNKKLMLREIYQKIHNVSPHPIERTTAFCILFIDGQFQAETHTDKDVPRRELLPKHAKELDDSDDDDCIIVDVTTGEPEKAQTENGASIRVKPLEKPQTENGATIRVNPLEKLQKVTSQNQCQFTNPLQTVTDSHRLQIVQGDNCAQPTVCAIDQQHQEGTLHNHQNLATFSKETSVDLNQLTIMQIDNNSQPIDQQLQVQNGPIVYIPLSSPFVALPYATTEQQGEPHFGLVPFLNLPANTIITNVHQEPAPQEMPIYISSLLTQSNTPNIPSFSDVNKVNVQPTVSDPMVSSESTKVTFLTPDVCVTSTAKVTGDKGITFTPTNSVVVTKKINTSALISVANPIWKLPLSNVQSVATHRNEVAEYSTISNEQHNLLPDGQTKSKKVSLIPDVLNRSIDVLPKVNMKTADPQAVTQQPKNIGTAQLNKRKQLKLSTLPKLAFLSPKTYLKPALRNAARPHNAYSARYFPTNSQTNKCLNVVSKYVQKENVVSPKVNLSKAGMNLSNISGIGSTIKYADPSNMTFTVEGNAFEPDATVVFKRTPLFLNEEKDDSKNRILKSLNSSLPPYRRTANSVRKATTTYAATKLPTKSMKTVGEKISYKSGVLVKGLAGNSSKSVAAKRPFNVVTSTSTTTTRTLTTSTPITTMACSKQKTAIGSKLSKPTVKTANVSVIAATPTNSGTTVNTTPKTTVPAVKMNPFNTLQHKRTCIITTVKTNLPIACSAATGKNNLQHTISSPRTVTGSNVTPVFSSNGIFGILCSNHPDVQKFQGKRFRNYFMVKVPNVGTLHMLTIKEVSSYLNQHVLKLNPNLKLTKKLTWKFIPKQTFPKNALTSNKSLDVPISKEQQKLNILPTLKTSAATLDMSDGIEETDTIKPPPLYIECEDPILIDD